MPFELQWLGTGLVGFDGRFRRKQALQPQPIHGFEICLFMLIRAVPLVKKSHW